MKQPPHYTLDSCFNWPQNINLPRRAPKFVTFFANFSTHTLANIYTFSDEAKLKGYTYSAKSFFEHLLLNWSFSAQIQCEENVFFF